MAKVGELLAGPSSTSSIPKNPARVHQIEVGQGPHGVRAGKDSRYVYTAVTEPNQVAVIDTR
ncbi:MAG: hypothetical protein ABEJ96_04540 [Thiohalorhabdaceae bacterium]